MHSSTARQSKRKVTAGICMFAAMIFLLAGSRVSDASGFRMEYSILNREESADLTLTEGDCLLVSLSHTEGTVDVTVGMEGQTPIYRGNGQQNAEFVLEIAETGSYHIFVSGHQAKGNISFTRIPEKTE